MENSQNYDHKSEQHQTYRNRDVEKEINKPVKTMISCKCRPGPLCFSFDNSSEAILTTISY